MPENTNPLVARRASLLKAIALPQLAIAALFIITRGPVWAQAWKGTTYLLDFFVELVTAGAGWPMLSIAALIASLAWHRISMDRELVLQVRGGFADHPASVVESARAVFHETARRSVRLSKWLAALVVVIVAGSVLGALAADYSIAGDLLSFLAAIVLLLSYFVPEELAPGLLGLEDIYERAILGTSFSALALEEMRGRNAAGRFDTPASQEYFERFRAAIEDQ